MRSKDLVVGQDYMYEHKPTGQVRRVRILEVGVTYRYPRPRKSRRGPLDSPFITSEHGVSVLRLENDGTTSYFSRREIVLPIHIAKPWAEHEIDVAWNDALFIERRRNSMALNEAAAGLMDQVGDMTGASLEYVGWGFAKTDAAGVMSIAGALEGLGATPMEDADGA